MGKMISSKHLEGVSDLTLSAPIKQGFIDAFEAVTYETRLRQIMKALFRIRATSREFTRIKPFVDTAERIQALLDFRLAIHGKELLLSATFDRPFEPYLRLIWDPLGPLLDVIFCNCEGYVTATEHGFDEFLAWVRNSQIDTDFFYAANGLTIEDVQYLMQVEKLQREQGKAFSPLGVKVENPMDAAKATRESDQTRKQSNELGIEALVAMHKLTDFYPPDRPGSDGKYLRWATQQLLEGWGRKDLGLLSMLVEEQLAWFEGGALPPRKPSCGERLEFNPANVQGGILESYGKNKPVLKGALLLLRIAEPARARAFLMRLVSRPTERDKLRIQTETADGAPPAGDTFLNLAFTRHGLANIGLPQAELARFPQEFLEGMEERAGLLGDIKENHPRCWKLPPRNGSATARPDIPVGLAEVDVVVQLRTTLDGEGLSAGDAAIDALIDELRDEAATGLELLSIERMQRAPEQEGIKDPEHFGFADGISQPRIASRPGPRAKDETPLGDIFLGYCNSRTDSPPPPNAILDDGTFLVVRKLSQNVGALRSFIEREAAELKKIEPTITADILVGKLLGRHPQGRPVADPVQTNDFNDFTYSDEKGAIFNDPAGTGCPFHAHVRRTHPRAGAHGREGPRILRRGLSYGGKYSEATKDEPRGVFFMAYNASIAEQFEVIQRWVIGGNSTGIASWQNDPLIGTAPDGEPRIYQFVHNKTPLSVTITEAFVELQWGAYLFVPSISGIRAIAAAAADRQAERQAGETRQASRGKAIIDELRSLAESGAAGRVAAAAEWKTRLEDFGAKDPAEKDEAAAIWASIRLHHRGAVKVPYGLVGLDETPQDAVLVASKDLVMRVFRDPHGHYSMSGQMVRMRQSFGEIYLGMDKGPEYKLKSEINEKIFAIPADTAFKIARGAAIQCIVRTFALAEVLGVSESKMDLRRHLITPALAIVCNRWFGIPDVLPPNQPASPDNFVDPWGWSWDPAEGRNPRCPGDYMSTSRFCFYPDPLPKVRAYGKSQGQALRKAVKAWLDKPLPAGQTRGSLTEDLLELRELNHYSDNDEVARTLIGVMTGFLPPADGCMRWAFFDWIEDETLPRVQHDLLSHPSQDPFERADRALRPWLERAMQKRPAPDLLWRTATRDHRLGNAEVGADDRVIVSIVSALAEDEAAGITDIYPVFGGNRAAADAPLHACPAYKAAMGTMLGILSGLLEAVRIEPLPATLLVKVSEPNPLLAPEIANNANLIRAQLAPLLARAQPAPVPPVPPPGGTAAGDASGGAPPDEQPAADGLATGGDGGATVETGDDDGTDGGSRCEANEKADEPAG